MNIKLNDLSFYPDPSCSKYHKSHFITWDRSGGYGPIVFFTDLCLSMVNMPCYKNSFKVAWIIEPFVTNQSPYHYIADCYKSFDLVLSHHNDLLKKLPNGQWYPNAMSWITEEDWKLYPKTKNVSIVASNKAYAPGHALRHKVIRQLYHGEIDVYGSGYNPVKDKVEALRDYRYSIAIENCQVDNYFSEKILDCFATGTVPIYWGSPKIADHFNPDGIITFNTIEELKEIIKNLDDKYYLQPKVQEALNENFILAKFLGCAEDWIYNNILVPKELV